MRHDGGEHGEQAESIVDGLLSEERRNIELEEGLSIADIESNAESFRAERQFLERIGQPFPCLRFGYGSIVPFSISPWLQPGFPSGPYAASQWLRLWKRDHHFFEELFHGLFGSIQSEVERGDGFEFVDSDRATAMFRAGATTFLAARISVLRGLRQQGSFLQQAMKLNLRLPRRLSASTTTSPGCLFTVTTDNPGLNVFWSGAYYISPMNFGSPTSPVSAPLQSGHYVFGINGGAYGNAVQWERSFVCPLPGTPSVHLNF